MKLRTVIYGKNQNLNMNEVEIRKLKILKLEWNFCSIQNSFIGGLAHFLFSIWPENLLVADRNMAYTLIYVHSLYCKCTVCQF